MSRLLRLMAAVAVVSTFASTVPTCGLADEEDAKKAVAQGKEFLDEGDKAADRGETTEAVIQYKRAFEKLLPGMRHLPFKEEVKRDVTEREALQTVLIKEIDEEMTPGEFRASELGMKALGLLPREVDLKKIMVKVYSEEIAAFYDPKTKTMHLIKEPEEKDQKPPTFLERLLGKKTGFDKDENKTVIAHELTHALADQNFGLDALQKAVKKDDDRSLALSALIEGEATLAMIGAQMNDWDGSVIREVPAGTLDRIFSLLIPLMPLTGGKSLREAPVILSESMIFPYLRGMVFCARLTNEGGWQQLTDAYKRPPLSTEQILHPEKYLAKPDAPQAIDLGKLEPGRGWTELGRNVVGEMQLSVLLRRHGGKGAAAGWDGDRFAVFEGSEGKMGLVWYSTWDDVAEAREFQKNYVRFQTTKLGDDAQQPDNVPDRLVRVHDGATFTCERRGQDVLVVEGFTAESTERLADAAWKARKTEITYDLSLPARTTP